MKTPTLRPAVAVATLIGFAAMLAALRVQGAALLTHNPLGFLLVIAALGAVCALGFAAWDPLGSESALRIASGLRSFAGVHAGAGLAAMTGRALTGEDGSGLAAATLATGIVVGLLSWSVDRRAWLADAPVRP